MIAIILAAGFGTRMYPYTLDTPKALLPIKNTTCLEILLTQLYETNEIEKYIIVTNLKFKDKFTKYILNDLKLVQKHPAIRNKIEIISNNALDENSKITILDNLLLGFETYMNYYDIKFKNTSNFKIYNRSLLICASDNILYKNEIKRFMHNSNKGINIMYYKQSDLLKVTNSMIIVINKNDGITKCIEKPTLDTIDTIYKNKKHLKCNCVPPFYIFNGYEVITNLYLYLKNIILPNNENISIGKIIEYMFNEEYIINHIKMKHKRIDIGSLNDYIKIK